MEKAFEKIKETVDISDEQLKELEDFAKDYAGKSEKDIFFDIIELNKKLSKDMDPEQMQNMLGVIGSMLDGEQAKRFQQLMKILNNSK